MKINDARYYPQGAGVRRGRKWWHTVDPIGIYVGDRLWTVPAGYRTDAASVPRIFRWFIGRTEWWIFYPAICHDFLLEHKLVTRFKGDQVFLQLIRSQTGAPRIKSRFAYWAVRLGSMWRTIVSGRIKPGEATIPAIKVTHWPPDGPSAD